MKNPKNPISGFFLQEMKGIGGDYLYLGKVDGIIIIS